MPLAQWVVHPEIRGVLPAQPDDAAGVWVPMRPRCCFGCLVGSDSPGTGPRDGGVAEGGALEGECHARSAKFCMSANTRTLVLAPWGST